MQQIAEEIGKEIITQEILYGVTLD